MGIIRCRDNVVNLSRIIENTDFEEREIVKLRFVQLWVQNSMPKPERGTSSIQEPNIEAGAGEEISCNRSKVP